MVYGLLRCLPGDNFATVACGNDRKLDTSIKMSGQHDLAVRLRNRSLSALPASTTSRPAFCDDRETPLWWDETGKDIGLICHF